MASLTAEHLAERTRAKEKELGRKLTAQELIDVINEQPNEPQELVFEPDEDLDHPQ